MTGAICSLGFNGYKKQTWRIAHEDYYVELGYGVSFNDIAIDVNETKSASVSKSPSRASWSSYTDFDYTILSGNWLRRIIFLPVVANTTAYGHITTFQH